MKSIKILLLACCILSVFACQQAPKADKATVSDAKKVDTNTTSGQFVNYVVNTTDSRVTFTGTKPVGQHKGYFNLEGGSLSMVEDEVKGGNFSIAIPSLTIIDAMPVEMANNLKGHLLGEDFFKSENFPLATFNITRVSALERNENIKLKNANYLIEGNLRLLDTTRSISFPAVIKTSGGTVKASANFNINRTDFGMSYGNDKSLGDKFINPVVNLQVRLIAKQ